MTNGFLSCFLKLKYFYEEEGEGEVRRNRGECSQFIISRSVIRADSTELSPVVCLPHILQRGALSLVQISPDTLLSLADWSLNMMGQGLCQGIILNGPCWEKI